MLNFKVTSAQESISINEIESKLIQNKKYIIIELYTGWCGICAIQDKKIQKNDELIKLLENEVYHVKFDAESTESFILNGIKFENKNGKIHEFAKAISVDSNAFPAWVIMNPKFEVIFQYNGLIETEDLKSILLKLNKLY
ncbi:thioredoxin fold domain-containing protein [Moheibacter sediminis]|uniref:thioredoxin fold domain-containing protein n=1 Tax=Moheibacter sediminis TaxID=1434700 RepID=UPI000A006B96|nr:thioredoxin fold domain-containing protein [Moheibacter sediminis]